MSIAQNQALALAKQFNIQGDPQELVGTLKATAFKGNATDAQFNALMIVATQYGLNPFTKEIYAFPDKGGITPVVGIDGWARIINGNPQFDGMEFEQDSESCTCKIYRKDRAHPISVTEFLEECKRNTQPWQSHPRRMLRHKAMIQAARLAFGFGGIYDEDEAERIKNNNDGAKENQANPFSGQDSDGKRAQYIAEAEKFVAAGNVDGLREYLQSDKAIRQAIGADEMRRLGETAKQNQNTVDAQYTEVSGSQAQADEQVIQND